MTRRTYEGDAKRIEFADDLSDIVQDKRKNWRANPSNIKRRKRRYEKKNNQSVYSIWILDRMKFFCINKLYFSKHKFFYANNN
ncbi:MAG: hypothetical protein CMP38_03810 [Rickettsiales bacterium]|nr:hypothetical protein [Rickettsiales bacterium]OUW03144.1 MAG: hypothetical protein CBD16_03530 [Betaproteobacteria bacterium TMED156]